MRVITTFLIILLFHSYVNGQVKTNYNNSKKITSTGQYNKNYKASLYDINPPDTNKIIAREAANKKSNDVKPFRFAEPIAVSINVVESAQWIEDSSIAYGKFSIRVKNAKSLSINFSDFFLPSETEMFIYNKTGNMITGPITEKENNKNRIWGSSVYKGDELTVELKLPKTSKKYLKLNIENVAFGYKEIYGFGNSSNCNINVLCPLGNGWEQERNSVALILNQDGSSWCTGSLINNTCNVSTPYFLTANHCFTGQDVTRWRFIFQYWSPSCTPNQDDLNNLLFNSSTLRANNAGSDFALVELSQTPDASSNITYAGWSRETAGKLESTIIHHPAGDVMKISRDNDAPTFSNFLGAQCWQLGLDLGATNGGSSGAPYFDQNHRIIAQHYGINQNNSDQCLNTNKFGGRFDISWTGGGTNATRLSNWLDPINTGAINTNTTNVSDLIPFQAGGLVISGSNAFCTGTLQYTLNVPAGTNVSWQSSNTNIATVTANGNPTTVTRILDGVITITATVTSCGNTLTTTKEIVIGAPQIDMVSFSNAVGGQGYWCSSHINNFFSVEPAYLQNYSFEARLLNYPSMTVFRTNSNANTGTDPFGYVPSGWYIIQLRTNNSCGTSQWFETEVEYVNCLDYGGGCPDCPFRISVSPNPSDGDLNVVIDKEKTEVKALSKQEKVLYQLYNFNRTSLVKQWTFDNSQNRQSLNVRRLGSGQYILVVTKGKYRQSTQIIIK